jgi:ABC-type Fe3+-citrate transport system substrate-binding protein
MILMLLNVSRDTVATLTSTASLPSCCQHLSLVNVYWIVLYEEQKNEKKERKKWGVTSYWKNTEECQDQRIADNGDCVFYDLKGCSAAFRCSNQRYMTP